MGALSHVHWLLVIVVAIALRTRGPCGVGKGLGEAKSFKKG